MPWRRQDDALEILLITTLTSRRWIVPKGWPEAGLSPAECAALEALEEAGVVGEISRRPIGAFHYDKHRKDGTMLHLRVEVFGLEVMRQRRQWAEKAARETGWFSPADAMERIGEPSLRLLIAKFARTMQL